MKKKKRISTARSKFNYFWILLLIVTGFAIWQFDLLWMSLPLGATLVYYIVAAFRNDRSAFLPLAMICMLFAVCADMLLALAIGFWNIYGDAKLLDLLWPGIILNIPLVATMFAYFYYRREFGLVVPSSQRMFAKIFDVAILALAAASLWAAIDGQVGVGIGPFVAIVAAYFACVGIVQRSRLSTFVALCLFVFAIGTTVANVTDVNNFDPKSALVALFALWNLTVILLTFAVTRILFGGEQMLSKTKRSVARIFMDGLAKSVVTIVYAIPFAYPLYIYLFSGDAVYGEGLWSFYAQLIPWTFSITLCLMLYYFRKLRVQRRAQRTARFELSMFTFWLLTVLTAGAYRGLALYDTYMFPRPSTVFLLTMIVPLAVVVFPKFSRAGLRIAFVTMLFVMLCSAYGIWSAINPLQSDVWAVATSGFLGLLLNILAINILLKRSQNRIA